MKRHPTDFVLWKTTPAGDAALAALSRAAWPSKWGLGRPGWHIECSAMCSAVFGDNIDVHAGGIDLLFPHHENEVAQVCTRLSLACVRWVVGPELS